MVDIKEVLEQVNKLRIAVGMEPLEDLPKGVQYRPDQCPMARSMPKGWHVGTYQILTSVEVDEATADAIIANWGSVDGSITEKKDSFINPPVITQFISEFDHKEWPQYLSDEEPSSDDSI